MGQRARKRSLFNEQVIAEADSQSFTVKKGRMVFAGSADGLVRISETFEINASNEHL
jgi:hypothetical protein